MSEKTRFNQALELLEQSGRFSTAKELAEIIGVNPDRIKYLRKGAQLKPSEIISLNSHYPDINWEGVNSGLGSLKKSDEQISDVIDPASVYGSDAWKKAELLLIKSGKSKLPIEQREELLIERLNDVEQKLLEIHEINSKGMIDTLKDMLRGK